MIKRRVFRCSVQLLTAFLCWLNSVGVSSFVTCSQQRRVSLSLLAAAAANEGQVTVCRPNGVECTLAYKVVRPMALSSRQAAPIVVLHGGPSVPSDYLYPLEQHVPYRSIVFYDQVGCGRSSEPEDSSCYSIEYALDDLEQIIQKLGIQRFHLYGQSFGGILAFEYLKRQAEKGGSSDAGCLSAILSSTPTNVAQVEAEANSLIDALSADEGDDCDVAERFRLTHQCRTPEKPQPLVDAYAHAGTVWRGTTAISGYSAKPPSDDASRMRSAMVMRGEFDFVTESCVSDWKTVFNHKFVRFKTLPSCSHHGLLENGNLYGDAVDSYFSEYD